MMTPIAPHRTMPSPYAFTWVCPQRGFTLIELVMVIVILGAVGSTVAVFMKGPIDAYFASGRRAALTDAADTAVRRMARDIRTALPNSVRVNDPNCVHFIPTKTGGRYRADNSGAGLDFTTADTTFNMLGNNDALPADQQIAQNDVVVVYNLGIAGADAYAQENTAVINAVAPVPGPPIETALTIAARQFPLASPSNRFQVVPAAEQVVSYVCNGAGLDPVTGNGTGTLRRTAVNVFQTYAANNCPIAGPVLANNVSACAFNYTGPDLTRNALLSMSIQLTTANETVSLQQQVNVSNTP